MYLKAEWVENKRGRRSLGGVARKLVAGITFFGIGNKKSALGAKDKFLTFFMMMMMMEAIEGLLCYTIAMMSAGHTWTAS